MISLTSALTSRTSIHLARAEQAEPEPEMEMENTVIVSEPGSSHYLPGHGKPYEPRASADAQESMKAKVIAIRRKLVEQVRGVHACGEPVKSL